MTEEEIKQFKDECTNMWYDHFQDIDFQGISDIYRRNGWEWGGTGEPSYIPEYRDIKLHIKQMFFECVDLMVKHYKDHDIDYAFDQKRINCGRMLFVLQWDDDSEGIQHPTFHYYICDDLGRLDHEGVESYTKQIFDEDE